MLHPDAVGAYAHFSHGRFLAIINPIGFLLRKFNKFLWLEYSHEKRYSFIVCGHDGYGRMFLS